MLPACHLCNDMPSLRRQAAQRLAPEPDYEPIRKQSWPGAAADLAPLSGRGQSPAVSTAKLRWLWLNCRDATVPGVSGGAVIIIFVIMPGVRS